MACPQCESNNVTPTMNMNESACLDCGCEYKVGGKLFTIYEHGKFDRFVESVFDEIGTKIMDPSVTSALKTKVPGYLNEGARSLRYLINDLIESADHLHNQYLAGFKEQQEFTAVMEAIKRFYTWAKLNEQADIIPEGYDEENPDYDYDLDGDNVGLDGEPVSDPDGYGDNLDDILQDYDEGYDEENPDFDDGLGYDNVGLDGEPVSDPDGYGNDELEDILGTLDDAPEEIDTFEDCGEDPSLIPDMTVGMQPEMGMEPEAGIPPSDDIAVDRIQDAAEEIVNAVEDLKNIAGDDEEQPVVGGITPLGMVAPQNMGLGGSYISEDFSFKLGDKVFVDNVPETCTIVEIKESFVTVADAQGNRSTIDMADEYRSVDIQFSNEEANDIIMERANQSTNSLRDKYLAMMNDIDETNSLSLNFNANTLAESAEAEEVEEGANSGWNKGKEFGTVKNTDANPQLQNGMPESYPKQSADKLKIGGATADESVEKEGEVLEEGTDDTGLGMDSDTGMGNDVDEGGEEAAEKKHDMDGEVTSSVEVADDESDGIDFPDVGDNTGVEELHEQKREALRQKLADQMGSPE